ncbi:hypothetical protein PanWU01x14_212290 [Parasponia andersonii]|uniref:Uncharacterized protein n=1 Tax=Parasponia andersonii TaxID=3476 RepID=A0A2P5BT65_PARAD|nr:hypothetical protein PanWU01x14_212290 [Parasponia andersonii]
MCSHLRGLPNPSKNCKLPPTVSLNEKAESETETKIEIAQANALSSPDLAITTGSVDDARDRYGEVRGTPIDREILSRTDRVNESNPF